MLDMLDTERTCTDSDLNGAANMFSSLLPLRSKESVTGRFMVKPFDRAKSLQSVACLSCLGRNQVGIIFPIQRSSSSMVTPLALVRNHSGAMCSMQFGTVGIK